jgi:hypothetical protein
MARTTDAPAAYTITGVSSQDVKSTISKTDPTLLWGCVAGLGGLIVLAGFIVYKRVCRVVDDVRFARELFHKVQGDPRVENWVDKVREGQK